MRGFAYLIAGVVAVGLVFTIGTMPVEVENQAATTVSAEAGTLRLNVPEMHCEVACFPRVKEALEGADRVTGVELAEQKEEGIIDNRQVIVRYDAGFDLSQALALLAEEGYESDPVQ